MSLLGTILGPTFVIVAAVLTLSHAQGQRGSRPKSRRHMLAPLLLLVLIAIAAIVETVGAVGVAFDFGALGVSLFLLARTLALVLRF